MSDSIISSAEFVIGVHNVGQLKEVESLPQIAFAGRSNVGKSSLINALSNRRSLAISSKTPGRTRALNFFEVCFTEDKARAYYVDLPGYGYAEASKAEQKKWIALLEHYLMKNERLHKIVLLVDSRRGLQDEEFWFFEEIGLENLVLVLTKVDKLKKNELAKCLEKISRETGLAKEEIVQVSSLKKQGVKELNQLLFDNLFK